VVRIEQQTEQLDDKDDPCVTQALMEIQDISLWCRKRITWLARGMGAPRREGSDMLASFSKTIKTRSKMEAVLARPGSIMIAEERCVAIVSCNSGGTTTEQPAGKS